MSAADVTRAWIHVMYGARGRVVAEVSRLASTRSPIAWLDGDAEAPHAWQGLRQLAACAADVAGPAALAKVTARHRHVLAILYPEMRADLDDDEAARSRALCADQRSHYTYSWASLQPLIQAAASLVVDLLVLTSAVVSVPELADLDALSRFALFEAFRVHGGRLIGLCVGHDPALARPPELQWGVPVNGGIAPVRGQLCDYQLSPDCRISWLAELGPSRASPGVPMNVWSAASPDASARGVLGAQSAAQAQLEHCMFAMRWAFESYAFEQVFRLGLLLEPHRLRLAPEMQAEHASLTATAASNVNFVDRPTPGFDETLFAMYERAIALCADPDAAASLATRLAFAAVDRRGARVDERLERATVMVARLDDSVWTSYLGAWLAVSLALHELHREDLAAAYSYQRRASAALERAVVLGIRALSRPLADRLQYEASCVRFMILAHCAVHAAGLDDRMAAQWLAETEEARSGVPSFLMFEIFHWALLPQRDEDRRCVYERCCAGIHDAEGLWNARSWYFYVALAADSMYRLGDAREAAEQLCKLLARGSFGNPARAQVGDLGELALRVFLRAGYLAELLDTAERWLADPSATDSAVARAMMGWALAVRGDGPGAATTLDAAIEDAVAGGDRRTLLCVAIIVVQVMMVRRDDAEALRALDSAWQLAEHETGQFSDDVSAQDCLQLCLLQGRLVGPTHQVVARALALLPSCLRSAESWWDVTELLDHALACRDRDAALPADARAGVALVRRLVHNRPEWRPRLDLLEPSGPT
jgi:hypothetical protein